MVAEMAAAIRPAVAGVFDKWNRARASGFSVESAPVESLTDADRAARIAPTLRVSMRCPNGQTVQLGEAPHDCDRDGCTPAVRYWHRKIDEAAGYAARDPRIPDPKDDPAEAIGRIREHVARTIDEAESAGLIRPHPVLHVTMGLPPATAKYLVASGRAVYANVDNGPALHFRQLDEGQPVADYSEAAADAAAKATAAAERRLLQDMMESVANRLDGIADGLKDMAAALPPPPISSLMYVDADGLHVPDREAVAANLRATYVWKNGEPDARDQQFLDVWTDHLLEQFQATAAAHAAMSPAGGS